MKVYYFQIDYLKYRFRNLTFIKVFIRFRKMYSNNSSSNKTLQSNLGSKRTRLSSCGLGALCIGCSLWFETHAVPNVMRDIKTIELIT